MKWLDVVGYEGLYQVSDTGLVRSLDRIVSTCYGATRAQFGKPVPQFPNKKGHVRVCLWRDGKRVNRFVHRLVLLAFRGPCPEGMEGCHGDGFPANNHVGNLRWDTPRGNWADRRAHGRGTWRKSA